MTTTNADKTVIVFFDLGDTLVSDSAWIAGAKQMLAALRGRGVRLGIISNTGSMDRTQLAAHLPADFDLTQFDASLIILSGEVGFEKPDSRIFDLAVERAGAGSIALFCNEDLLHSVAAQLSGLIAVRVMPPPASDVAALLSVLEGAKILAGQ